MEKFNVTYPDGNGGLASVPVHLARGQNGIAVVVTQPRDHHQRSITNAYDFLMPTILAECIRLSETDPSNYPVSAEVARLFKPSKASALGSLLNMFSTGPRPAAAVDYDSAALFFEKHLKYYEVFEKPLIEAIRYQKVELDEDLRPIWITVDKEALLSDGLVVT